MAKVLNLPPVRTPNVDAHLAAIIDSSFDAIISKDLNSIITTWNPAAERLFGYSASEAVGRSILMLIPENRRSEEVEIIDRVRRGERVDTFETIRLKKDGTHFPVSLTVSPIKSAGGEIIGASKIARDITATKESERRIRVLMREVNHRVKNQFAVILSMVRETSKRTTDPEQFETTIRDRIMALSRSHDLLVTSEWTGASLVELIQEHLKPFGHEEQISLAGPLITLQPNAVQHLGMAFHELGTNAAKYGALSSDVGRIEISWQIVAGMSGAREFFLTWHETSVPQQASSGEQPAARIGFGSIVLARVTPSALGGTSVLDRAPGFIRWSVTAPLVNVTIGTGGDGL